MIFYGQRVKLETKFVKWAEKEKIARDLFNLITYLELNDLLNETKVIEFLKEDKDTITEFLKGEDE